MKNPLRLTLGIVTLLVGMLAGIGLMALCAYVIQFVDLYDEEMVRCLLLPLIMTLPVAALIYPVLFFRSKAKKFTNGTFIDTRPSYYKRVVWFFVSLVIQYLLGFLVTLPLFAFDMGVCAPMLVYLLIAIIPLLIADALCYWVFYPISDEIK